jgi:hypothetical protein
VVSQGKSKTVKGPNSRTSTCAFYLALLAFAALAACAIPHIPSRVVYEDPVNFVRLEDDPSVEKDVRDTWHSHPAVISPEVMAAILKGLSVQEHRIKLQRLISGEAPREPAFRDEDIAWLAPKLAEALGRAEPQERVTYYLSRPQTSIKREITTGGLYVRGERLHFILGNHRITYGIPSYGMVYDRRYPTKPTAAKGFDLNFEPESAVIKQPRRFWNRWLGREKDEIVIDLKKVKPVVLSASAAVTAQERAG